MKAKADSLQLLLPDMPCSDFQTKITGMIKGRGGGWWWWWWWKLSLKRLKTSTRIKLRCDIGAEITRLGVLITMIKMLRDLMIKAVTCNKRPVM